MNYSHIISYTEEIEVSGSTQLSHSVYYSEGNEEESPIEEEMMERNEHVNEISETDSMEEDDINQETDTDSESGMDTNIVENDLPWQEKLSLLLSKVSSSTPSLSQPCIINPVEDADMHPKIQLESLFSCFLSSSPQLTDSSSESFSIFFNKFKFFVIQTIFDHVLFMNNLIPCPLKMLRQQFDEELEQKNNKMTLKLKKISKFLLEYDEIFNNLEEILSQNLFINQIFILFGPSVSNVRKKFVINFPVIEEGDAVVDKKLVDVSVRDQRLMEFVHRVNRTIIRNLIQYEVTDDVNPFKRTNVFFVINFDHPASSLSSLSSLPSTKPMDNLCRTRFLVPSSFYYKQNFVLRERKRGPKNKKVNFFYKESHFSPSNQWLVQKKGLKSL